MANVTENRTQDPLSTVLEGVTGQLADATGDCVLSFRSFGGICETASCPVCELSSYRRGQSVSKPINQSNSQEFV